MGSFNSSMSFDMFGFQSGHILEGSKSMKHDNTTVLTDFLRATSGFDGIFGGLSLDVSG